MKSLALLAALVVSGFAFGQTAIGPFTGDLSEGFEAQPQFQFLTSYSIFGGQGQANSIGGQGLHVTNSWAFISIANPHSGNWFMGGASSDTEIVFNTAASRFGGYFTTNAQTAGGTIRFFDTSNVLISSQSLNVPLGGAWQWNGWQYGAGIKRVEIIGANSFPGFVMMDDLQYSAVPEPATMAALGLGALAMLRRRKSA